MDAVPRELVLDLDTTRAEVGRAVEELHHFCAAVGADAEVAHDLCLAADEVLANVVLHGYCGNPGGTMQLRAVFEAGAFTLDFRDGAPPFDPLGAAPPDLDCPEAERAIGGLGIHLVRASMDEIRYSREAGFNRLILRRHAERRAGH